MNAPLGIYRSNITPPERLLVTSVGREHILNDVVEKLVGAIGKKSKQHYLFIGTRGIGKTHLLTLIENALVSNEKAHSCYTCVRFPEENNRLLSFADFLLGIVEILAKTNDDGAWLELHQGLATNDNDDEIIDTLEPKLAAYQKQSGKTLLIMLENIDVLFTQNLKSEKEMHRFRSFLMDSPCATLIATSPVYFPAIYAYQNPFYDFFDIQALEEFTEEQTIEVIRKNLEWEKRGELLASWDSLIPKIQALQEMTGGNPRLIMMLYELIAHEDVTEVTDQFKKLLDQISPFYQDRLKVLAPQERAILETIALMRLEPRTPATIAKKLRMSQQQTSALLKRLLQAGYLSVTKNSDDKRSRFYRIKEGFFDLWLAMNESRLHNKKLPYLVAFFERYYSDKREREKKRQDLWEKCKHDGDSAHAVANGAEQNSLEMLEYLSEVGDEQEKIQTKLELAHSFLKEGKSAYAQQQLTAIMPILPRQTTFVWMTEQTWRWADGEIALDVQKWLEDIISYWRFQRRGELEKAVEIAQRLGRDLSGSALHAIRIDLLQDALSRTTDIKEQIELYWQISQSQKMDGRLADAHSSLEIALQLCRNIGEKAGEGTTLNNISQIYKAQGDYETALPYLKEALVISKVIGERAGEGATLNNIAVLYHAQGDYETALPYLKEALAIFKAIGERTGEGTTLNNISQIYKAQGDYETALSYLKEALAISKAIGERTGEGTTLNNISRIYKAQGDYETALPYLTEALAIFKAIGEKVREGTTLNNIAALYHAQGDYETALPYLKEALAIFKVIGDKAGEGTTLNNIAGIYHAQGDYETALSYLKEALAISKAIGGKAGLCATLFNMGHLHLQNGKPEEALRTWLTVYRLAKHMNEAVTLQALSNLAPQLGLSEGLSGWEALAQAPARDRDAKE